MIEAILSADSFTVGENVPEFVLRPGVIFLLIKDGSGRLLNLDGSFSALSSAGCLMLRFVLQSGIDEAIKSTCKLFDVNEERVRIDLERLLGNLEHWNYILRRGSVLPVKRDLAFVKSILNVALLIPFFRRSLRFQAGVLLLISWFSFRFLGWNWTITSWKEAAISFQKRPSTAPDTQKIADAVRYSSASLPWKIDCKEQTLACWFLCAQAGMPVSMVLGIMIYPLASHFWCEWEGQCLTDDPEKSRRYTPIIRYKT